MPGSRRSEVAGQPVVRITVWTDKMQLGQEVFRAGRWRPRSPALIIGHRPVRSAWMSKRRKIETRKLTAEYEKTGQAPAEALFFAAAGIEGLRR